MCSIAHAAALLALATTSASACRAPAPAPAAPAVPLARHRRAVVRPCPSIAVDPPRPVAGTGGPALAGRVTDPRTGAPLAGVVVVASSPALPEALAVLTDGDGRYRLADLAAGAYAVGFFYADLVARRPDVAVGAMETVELDARFDVGQAGEVIVSRGKPPALNVMGDFSPDPVERNGGTLPGGGAVTMENIELPSRAGASPCRRPRAPR